jgi:adenylylsulfate kinase
MPKTVYDHYRKKYNQKAVVIWFTGLSSSGKTSLSRELRSRLLRSNVLAYTLDGDQVREGLSSDLDFSKKGRQENIRRVGEVAKLFVDAGFIICVATISPFRRDRNYVRGIFPASQFIEVYLECPLEECERRDVKGLYKRARNGEILDFTGVSSPYEPPINPEIHLKTDIHGPQKCADQIINYLNANYHVLDNYQPVKKDKS